MVHWWRIHFLMLGMLFPSLAWELKSHILRSNEAQMPPLEKPVCHDKDLAQLEKKKGLTIPFKKNVRIWSSERKVTFPKSHSLSEVKLEFSAVWLGHFSRYRKWPHSHSRWTAGGLALPQKRLPQRRKTYVFWMSSGWVGPGSPPSPPSPPSLDKQEAMLPVLWILLPML